MEFDFVDADAVHRGFGFGKNREYGFGACGDSGLQAHRGDRRPDRGQTDMRVPMPRNLGGRASGETEFEALSAQHTVMVQEHGAARAGRKADFAQHGVEPRSQARKRVEQRRDEHVAGNAADGVEVQVHSETARIG